LNKSIIGTHCFCNCVIGEGVDEAVNFLKAYDKPKDKVILLWQLTAKRRLGFINGKEKPEVSRVIQCWPRYRDPDGYLLVSQLPML
jgi:hypothetical protein